MAIRFWRRFRIVPGLRINLSKSGASLSIGRRGAWYTIGPRGRRVTVGAPGTGLFLTQHFPPAAPRHTGRRLALAALVVVAIAALVVLISSLAAP